MGIFPQKEATTAYNCDEESKEENALFFDLFDRIGHNLVTVCLYAIKSGPKMRLFGLHSVDCPRGGWSVQARTISLIYLKRLTVRGFSSLEMMFSEAEAAFNLPGNKYFPDFSSQMAVSRRDSPPILYFLGYNFSQNTGLPHCRCPSEGEQNITTLSGAAVVSHPRSAIRRGTLVPKQWHLSSTHKVPHFLFSHKRRKGRRESLIPTSGNIHLKAI